MSLLDAYKAITTSAFKLEINLNDCFYWGCAYSTSMEGDDVEVVAPLYIKYGFETLMAYGSINEDDPGDEAHIKRHFDWDKFIAAKAELQPLADKGLIMWERHHRLEQEKKDKDDFGYLVVWNKNGMVPHERTKRFIPKADYMFQSARIPGLLAIGGSYYETRQRLLAKHLKRKK